MGYYTQFTFFEITDEFQTVSIGLLQVRYIYILMSSYNLGNDLLHVQFKCRHSLLDSTKDRYEAKMWEWPHQSPRPRLSFLLLTFHASLKSYA